VRNKPEIEQDYYYDGGHSMHHHLDSEHNFDKLLLLLYAMIATHRLH